MTSQTVNLKTLIGKEVIFANDSEQYSGVIESVNASQIIFDGAGFGDGSELDEAVRELELPPELLAAYFAEISTCVVSFQDLNGHYFLDVESGVEGVVTDWNAALGSINIDVTDIAPEPNVPYTPEPPQVYRPKPDGDNTPKWIWDNYKNGGRSS